MENQKSDSLSSNDQELLQKIRSRVNEIKALIEDMKSRLPDKET